MTDFPNSPVTGDTFTANGIEYLYDGTKWSVFGKKYSYRGATLNNTNNITTIDLSSGSFFELALSEQTAVQFSNPPASGFAQKFYLKLGIDTGYEDANIYDIENASYDNVSFGVVAQESYPSSVFFKPDGTKMYVMGNVVGNVNEYDLSTAWDISTASYLQNFSLAAQEASPFGLFFKPDGTKMYVIGFSGDDINEYDLSTAWDISTASYLQNFSVAAQEASPYSVFFKPDGTKVYIAGGSTGGAVNEYDLSTAWDVSTASYLQNFSVAAQEVSPFGLLFKPDGTKMYILGPNNNTVYQYTLSTAWNLSTASYDSVSFSVSAQDTIARGLFFKPDGTKMYIVGNGNDKVYQYTTTITDTVPNITWPSSIQWESGSAPTLPALGETDLLEFYTSDGGTTYYAKLAEDDIS